MKFISNILSLKPLQELVRSGNIKKYRRAKKNVATPPSSYTKEFQHIFTTKQRYGKQTINARKKCKN